MAQDDVDTVLDNVASRQTGLTEAEVLERRWDRHEDKHADMKTKNVTYFAVASRMGSR